MLKKVLVALGAVMVLLLALPMVLPATVQVTRSIVIGKSVAQVHSYLVDLNQYSKWDPFSEADPTSKAEVQGVGVGSSFAWKGNETGTGKMTITEIRANENVRVDLEFFEPMAGKAIVDWGTVAVDGGKTQVTWTMVENLRYFHRYLGLFMDSMVGKAFAKGLENLKKQLEQ